MQHCLLPAFLLIPLANASAGENTGALSQGSKAQAKNGFVVANTQVPVEKIVRGTVRDGVRAVDTPEFASLEESQRWVAPHDLVLGIHVEGEARAYPEHLLDFHQVVNDEVAGIPVVLFWDPIAGLPMAFERKLGQRTLTFGVAGLVYQSHCLFYDRETESLWLSQQGRAIAGPLAGQQLKRLALRKEPLGAWAARYPKTRVLERPLPRRLDYRYSPFSAHWASKTVPYPVDHEDPRYHPKDLVLGVEYPGGAKAYPGSLLTEAGGRVVDDIEGQPVRVAYDSDTASFQWQMPAGWIPYESYWFAWKALHPDTHVWKGLDRLKPVVR